MLLASDSGGKVHRNRILGMDNECIRGALCYPVSLEDRILLQKDGRLCSNC